MHPVQDTQSAELDALLVRPAGAPAREARGIREVLQQLEADASIRIAGAALPLLAAGELDIGTLRDRAGAEVAALAGQALALPALETMAGTGDDPDLPAAQGENLRRMLIAMVRDVRVMLIRLAQQLVHLRQLKDAAAEERMATARLVREIYAPLANRLGIWQIKWELEDLAFRYLEPDAYRQVAAWLAEKRTARERYIQQAIAELREVLAQEGIEADIQGRPKHIYSIWRKLQRKKIDFDQLYDLRAVRVLVDDVKDCYAALGCVHGRWRYVRGEFDDYITAPKENGYRSLHTVVFGPQGKLLEIQIRTRDMHRQAELGVASHWRYKEGASHDQSVEQRIAWLRSLLETPAEGEEDRDFIDRFKEEIFEDRVYVFTPRGEIFDLPAGATPLDFAYYVHTDIGHRCRGARVNGRMVPITRRLRTGDRVEILTSSRGEPSRDWLIPQLGYLHTPRARAKVKAWFRHQDHEQHIGQGRAVLERELARLGAGDLPYEKLVAQFPGAADLEAFLALLGSGDITVAQLAGAVQRAGGLPARGRSPSQPGVSTARRNRRRSASGVRVGGVSNLATQLARCCRPVPPEPITGFITRGRGISVHRDNCGNVQRADPQRLVAVSWDRDEGQSYLVDIRVEAEDRHGILRDISSALAADDLNIEALHSAVDRQTGIAGIRVTIAIRDLEQLSRTLHRIARLPGVRLAQRASG